MTDSKYLLFQSGNSIYRVQAKAGAKPSQFFNGSATLIRYRENDKFYVISGGLPAYLNRGRLTKYSFSVPFLRDRENYQRMGFRMAWREMRDGFYDGSLNHRDWDQIREKYELVAARAASKTTYGRVANMMLGELNGSHLGFYPTSFPGEWRFNEAWRKTTAHLGVRLDETRTVTFVHPNGPADRPNSTIKVGEKITKIDGKTLRDDTPITQTVSYTHLTLPTILLV